MKTEPNSQLISTSLFLFVPPQVVAVDQPVNGLSATAQINIIVLDVNDNNPQYSEFQSPITIPEDKTGKVTQIQVSDRDIDLNGEVTLTTYSHGDVFGFTSVRGVNTFKSIFLPETCSC